MRDQILSEIKRLAAANGGKPPGAQKFTSETGIGRSTWLGVYWPRWGDALTEAGFAPNDFNQRLDETLVFSKVAAACRHFGRVPTTAELRMYKKVVPDFPAHTMASTFGGKLSLLRRLGEWVRATPGYEDVAAMVPQETGLTNAAQRATTKEGFVYLFRSGAHYKIGRSEELERRVKEIRVALPEAATLEHSIRTDDPAGIEAYWHRRFADRQANGEWFNLSNADVAAFKRRKFQ